MGIRRHDFIKRKINREYVTFIENVVTKNEQLIAALLQNFFQSLNNREINKIPTMTAPEAIIDSRAAGRLVTVDDYCKAMSRPYLNDATIFFDSVSLYIRDSVTVRAVGILTVLWGSKRIESNEYQIDLVKREGTWLVMRTQYPKAFIAE